MESKKNAHYTLRVYLDTWDNDCRVIWSERPFIDMHIGDTFFLHESLSDDMSEWGVKFDDADKYVISGRRIIVSGGKETMYNTLDILLKYNDNNF